MGHWQGMDHSHAGRGLVGLCVLMARDACGGVDVVLCSLYMHL